MSINMRPEDRRILNTPSTKSLDELRSNVDKYRANNPELQDDKDTDEDPNSWEEDFDWDEPTPDRLTLWQLIKIIFSILMSRLKKD